jgi:acyl-CoA synthetase (AMP-forming)/AMP-acid ligase II
MSAIVLTFADPLRRAERCFADRLAVVDHQTRLTFRQLLERCRRVSSVIGTLTAPGDRVAVLGANSHQWLELYYALPWSGRTIVPLNARLTGPELAYQLTDGGATVLVTDRPAAVLGELSGCGHRVVALDDCYEAMLAAAAPVDPLTPIKPDSLAGIFYTGGTTGAAKGVMTTHGNKLADTFHLSTCVQLNVSDRGSLWRRCSTHRGHFNRCFAPGSACRNSCSPDSTPAPFSTPSTRREQRSPLAFPP